MASIDKYKSLVGSIGRGGISALFPNEFEYYFIGLELVDSAGNTVDYLGFPIVPNISKENPKATAIKRTARGVTALVTSSFVPKTFTLQGDFGRKFKFVMRGTRLFASTIGFSTALGAFSKENLLGTLPSIRRGVFSERLKTGYGAIKVLEAIFEKADMEDQKAGYKPYQLYFYNPTLGENYVVEPISLNLNQSKDKNMIWSFTLTLKAVAPLDNLLAKKGIKKSMATMFLKDAVRRGVNNVATSVASNL